MPWCLPFPAMRHPLLARSLYLDTLMLMAVCVQSDLLVVVVYRLRTYCTYHPYVYVRSASTTHQHTNAVYHHDKTAALTTTHTHTLHKEKRSGCVWYVPPPPPQFSFRAPVRSRHTFRPVFFWGGEGRERRLFVCLSVCSFWMPVRVSPYRATGRVIPSLLPCFPHRRRCRCR